MVSGQKVLRDILIMVVIAILGIMIWRIAVAPRVASQKQDTLAQSPHGNMMGSGALGEGDGTIFDIDNTAEAVKIEGTTYSIGDIDTLAKNQFFMLTDGLDGLTKEIRDELRLDSIRRILLDHALTKGADELGITIDEKDIENELKVMIENQGGQEGFDGFLNQYGVDLDSLKKLIKKDLMQNAITEQLTRDIELPEDENQALLMKQNMYNAWVEETALDLEFEIINNSILESFTTTSEHDHAAEESESPHGTSSTDTEITTDKTDVTETDSKTETES